MSTSEALTGPAVATTSRPGGPPSGSVDRAAEPDSGPGLPPSGPVDRAAEPTGHPGPDPLPGRPPGRPRSARADEAILEAVLDLLSDGTTVDALSMEAVAARAGVGKATIYRRWANKEALLVDAMRRLKGDPPMPAGVSVREDLIMLLSAMSRRHEDTRAMGVLPCIMPELARNPVHHRIYQEVIEPRREVMREVLRRGIRTGEIRGDIDIEITMAMLSAPVLIQKILRWNPAIDDEKLPERLVDAVLGGISA